MAGEKGYPSEKGFLSDKGPTEDEHLESGARSEVAHDFFGNPTNGGVIRPPHRDAPIEPQSNGHSNSARGVPPAQPGAEAILVARDPWTRLAVALILIGLVTCGMYARRQWNGILRALIELKSAPRAVEAHLSAIELADISLGGPGGKLAELSVDPKSGAGSVFLTFFNSGHTAARHFAVAAWTNARPGIPPLEYRQRFRNSAADEISLRGLSAFESTVAAGSPSGVTVPDEWMPSPEWLAEARSNPRRLFVVSGVFEYCDVLGNYRCGNFSIRYIPPPADRFVSWLTTSCRPLPPTPPAAPANSSSSRWIQLERCEQPAELGESSR